MKQEVGKSCSASFYWLLSISVSILSNQLYFSGTARSSPLPLSYHYSYCVRLCIDSVPYLSSPHPGSLSLRILQLTKIVTLALTKSSTGRTSGIGETRRKNRVPTNVIFYIHFYLLNFPLWKPQRNVKPIRAKVTLS